MTSYAESAYQHVSSELKYDLAHKVPLILFQTSSEFQQQNVVPEPRRKASAHSPSPSGSESSCRWTSRTTCSIA